MNGSNLMQFAMNMLKQNPAYADDDKYVKN